MLRLSVMSLALLSGPALANGSYRAEPVEPPTKARFVARDNVWRCGDNDCSSSRTASRPAIACAALAREVGVLRSFSVDGRPFDEGALASCNRRAR